MAVSKKYYPLDEAAQKLGVEFKAEDLIHFGAQGDLDIHLLADGWSAHLWEEKHLLVTLDPDSPAEFTPVSGAKRTLTGPYQLPTEVLQQYEANPQTTIGYLYANGCEEDAPEDIRLQYKLCLPDDPSQSNSISLASCKLVVMGRSLEAFASQHSIPHPQTDNPHHAKTKRKAPDKFVAALIRLLIEIARRAGAQGMPFRVTEMPGKKSDLKALADKFDTNLDYTSQTFDDYLAGLCQFKQGAQGTDFYKKLFPEYYK